MTSILVLGSTGMLGSQMAKVLSKKFNVTEANRTGIPVVRNNRSIQVNAREFESISTLFGDNNNFDYVINCIGSIKQLITQSTKSIKNAIFINSLLPFVLDELSKENHFRVIQICTDCVFSGRAGGSSEETPHDSIDIYGRTKSLGEVTSQNTMNIRCSVVGRELSSSNSLLEWFLSRPKNSSVSGYTNHFWNGVTTLHFSEVVQGLILSSGFKPGTFHLTPANQTSKYDLLSIFANEYKREDLHIEPIEMGVKVDRTLSSIYPETNESMWSSAGYFSLPTIQSMINELRIQNEMEKQDD